MLEAVYDLSTCKPHVDDDARFERAEWVLYWQGYYKALQMCLKVLAHAEQRFKLVTRTRRLETLRRRKDSHVEAGSAPAGTVRDVRP